MSRPTQTLYVTDIRYNEFQKDSTGKILTDQNGVRLISETPLKDKNNKEYCVVEFSTPDTKYVRKANGQMGTIKVPQVSVGGYSAWKESNLQSLKGKSDFGWGLQLGEEVQGTIAKRSVEPYEVNGRKVSTASVVSFADTADAEALELDIQAQFRRKGHILTGNTQRIADAENISNGLPEKEQVTREVSAQEQGAK